MPEACERWAFIKAPNCRDFALHRSLQCRSALVLAQEPAGKPGRIGFDIPAPPCQHRAMLGAPENQFSLTRAESSACVRAKSSFLLSERRRRMNYPVWEVAFGAGLLIALVAILHVFVSHFAVGGGLFLVVTERRARRNNDLALLGWLKAHTKFFVLVTVVFGAISGVGIWFTIGLIGPTATSNLIHAYVWGWAIEWVFFFVEITAALLYLYGWDKLEARLHEWYGWIYFIAAFASMVIINGIITFMLTSGSWVKTHEFWKGFFNPTYFPSLAFRFAIALALAGIYALITASVQKDAALKARLVRWSAWWIVPSLAVLPALGWWYIRRIPADVWASARGPMPTATHYALFAVILLGVTFALALLTLVRPGRMHLAFSLLVALVALGAMGSFEFVREAIRKPYVIANYLYANSLYSAKIPGDGGFSVDEVNATGILKSAKWISNRDLTQERSGGGGPRDISHRVRELPHDRRLPGGQTLPGLAPMGSEQDSSHAGQP